MRYSAKISYRLNKILGLLSYIRYSAKISYRLNKILGTKMPENKALGQSKARDSLRTHKFEECQVQAGETNLDCPIQAFTRSQKILEKKSVCIYMKRIQIYKYSYKYSYK
jgi:hypothetical protein